MMIVEGAELTDMERTSADMETTVIMTPGMDGMIARGTGILIGITEGIRAESVDFQTGRTQR